jgi:hypothetical protein
METPERIEQAFVAMLERVDGLRHALDHEPKDLPRLPCATMLFLRGFQADRETGPAQDVLWEWRIHLYVDLGRDWAGAQRELKQLLPRVLKLVRDDPTLDGTCDHAVLVDLGEEPVFATDDQDRTRTAWLLKKLMLRAETIEA